MSHPPSPSLLNDWKKMGFEFGQVYNNQKMDFNLIEWGKTGQLIDHQFQISDSIVRKSQFLNSKFVQAGWKTKHHNPLNVRQITHLNNVQSILHPFVLSREFGLSGGNKWFIRDESYKTSVLKILSHEKEWKLVVEDWALDRNFDFSGLFEIEQEGLKFLSITEMIIDAKGVYRGSRIDSMQSYNFQSSFVELIHSIFEKESISYKGPFSVDGFRYGENFQFFSEINFRWTMGRILYEIIQKIHSRHRMNQLLILPPKKIAELEQLTKGTNSTLIHLCPMNSKFGILFLGNSLE